MAEVLDNGKFWLPAEFLTDDDVLLSAKQGLGCNGFRPGLGPKFGFPVEFPYEMGSLGSPVESVVGSTETESDEDDVLAGLTRQFARSSLLEHAEKIPSGAQNFEKFWVSSGSPQSTLSAAGSWSVSSHGSPNGPSPPTTPLGETDAWDLIYAAAGQVARLKMNSEGPSRGGGLLGPHRSPAPLHHPSPPVEYPDFGFYFSHCNPSQDYLLKQQSASLWGRQTREAVFPHLHQQMMPQNGGGRVLGGGFERKERSERPLGLPQAAWPPLQTNHQSQLSQPLQGGRSAVGAVFHGGSAVKKQCAGTGVFLPRRYASLSSATRKKPGSSTATAPPVPSRVVPANGFFAQSTATPTHINASSYLPEEIEAVMARRTALLVQQRRSTRPEGAMYRHHHELCLPQEWTY
ncbi:uncharacterized protein LOC127791384 [Diospyros lotus]|uniref:uncharacterized protein LOC127791384 n=1 Tax=Diospyros lotus TaxID=55363 RepID=UPI00224E4759|nr:uncharacterized protein LOC127791384 [Diospyros lotus]